MIKKQNNSLLGTESIGHAPLGMTPLGQLSPAKWVAALLFSSVFIASTAVAQLPVGGFLGPDPSEEDVEDPDDEGAAVE